MANYASILAEIAAAIYTNDNEEITGAALQAVLLDMVTSLGSGYQFKGIATPSTDHGTPDQKVFYIGASGSYPNFGASADSPFVVSGGHIAVFRYDSVWTRESLKAVDIIDDLNSGGADKALSADMGKYLSAVIGDAGTPVDLSALTEQRCSLGTTAWYYASNTGKHKAVSVTPGERLTLKMVSYDGHTSGAYNGWYVFVTSSYNPPYSNNQAIPSTGSDARIAAPVGESIPLTAPSNAAYLVITTQDGAGVSPTWKVTRMTVPDETIVERLDVLTEDVENLQLTVGGTPEQQTSTWSGPNDSPQTINRVYWTAVSRAVLGGVVTVKLSNYTNYKVGLAVQSFPGWGTADISDTGWKQADIVKTITAAEAGGYIRVAIGKANDTSCSQSEALAVLSELTYTFVAGAGGLVDRVGNLEEENLHAVQRFPLVSSGSAVYQGRKVDFTAHSYTHSTLGTITNVSGVSRQGAAVFGDYLFQFHDTNSAVVVFKLSTGQSIQTISLTPNANCHANAACFGGQYYDAGDAFPCIYVSSEGESRAYVYRVTGTEGAFSLTLVQTLSFSVPFYYPNLHVDVPNDRAVVVGYAVNSWQSPVGNKMLGCCFDLPAVTAGDVELSNPYNDFAFPFILATQGAVARYGKLYHAFGNTASPYNIGGIVIVDYILHNVETFIDLSAIGNLEPEGLGLYDGGFIITTQARAVIKLSF